VGHKTAGGRAAQVKELNCLDGPPCDELMMGLVIWYTNDFFPSDFGHSYECR
jgi:hypothetical protein